LHWIQSRENQARGASFYISSPFFVHSCSHTLRSTNWAIDKLSFNSALKNRLPSVLRLLPLTCWTAVAYPCSICKSAARHATWLADPQLWQVPHSPL
jgi:hypothetical protein